MIRLDKPTQEAGEVFRICISRVQSTELKTRLEQATKSVAEASAEFDDAATHTQLHRIVPNTLVGGVVTQAEMEAVYTQRMAKIGAPGRHIYDELLTSTPQGKCPLCGHRLVSTLDHHLPKAHYPALAVAPLNLVPACSDCNKAKLTSVPRNAREEMLHPYFDDIDSGRWLFAVVIEERPTALRFFAQVPEHWERVLKSRIKKHFRTLGLARLYSSEAADELLNIRHQLQTLYNSGGAQLVQIELQRRAESCRQARRNGWRTAMYESLANNDWFCNGGFKP